MALVVVFVQACRVGSRLGAVGKGDGEDVAWTLNTTLAQSPLC